MSIKTPLPSQLPKLRRWSSRWFNPENHDRGPLFAHMTQNAMPPVRSGSPASISQEMNMSETELSGEPRCRIVSMMIHAVTLNVVSTAGAPSRIAAERMPLEAGISASSASNDDITPARRSVPAASHPPMSSARIKFIPDAQPYCFIMLCCLAPGPLIHDGVSNVF